MKNFKLHKIFIYLTGTIFLLTGCGGGDSSPVSTNDPDPEPSMMVISGSLNDKDISGATVTLKSVESNETIASASTGSSGTYSISVEEDILDTDGTYILSATNPVNGRSLRSMVSGASILSSEDSYSSTLTAISAYSEAAYLVAKTKNDSENPLPFLIRSLSLTSSGYPLSTDYDSVNALAVWIKNQFTDPDNTSDDSYIAGITSNILGVQWPVFLVEGSDVTITLPTELTDAGVIISVTGFNGPADVSVNGGSLTVTPGLSGTSGQIELLISVNGTEESLVLPVNTVGKISSVSEEIISGSSAPITFGTLTLTPSSLSFTSDTSINIAELDLSAISDTSMGDITITKAFDIELAYEPDAPITLTYQASGTPDPDKTVLIHINTATKIEQYVYPDSYDETTNTFTFTVDRFSPVLIGKLADTPTYSAGTTITSFDLVSDSVRAFGFYRNLADIIGDKNTLSSIQEQDIDTRARLLTYLSSKALYSFMSLPKTDPEGLKDLAGVTFNTQWFSFSKENAWEEYWVIRACLMQTLYRITNSGYTGISQDDLLTYTLKNDVSFDTDIKASVLGQADDSGNYYFPMVAYRVLKLGLTTPDVFFPEAIESIKNEDLDLEVFLARYHGMTEWINDYINYVHFTSPKISEAGATEAQLAVAADAIILNTMKFFGNTSDNIYAGLWLGASYDYSQENDIKPVMESFAFINDTLGDLLLFSNDSIISGNTVKDEAQSILGSSVTDMDWVSQGSYTVPPEVYDELVNLENWKTYLDGLYPVLYTWYRDADSDGFGDPETSVTASLRPEGYVADNSDPNDANNTIYPDSREVCGDQVDNDLNGLTDEGCSSFYKGTETTIALQRKSNNQFLIPVDVGNQTFNLLVDTGSDALLVFADKLADDSTVEVSATPFTKRYASTTREGVLAKAAVRVGGYYDPDMTIMVVNSPTSDNDPSLTAKEADGIIGLRRTQGISVNDGEVFPDAPLNTLEPSINIFELNLPPSGPAYLSLGQMATLDGAKSQYVFKAKTYTFTDPERPEAASYADLQVPFRAKSKFGEAASGDLDVLFDSGAVSKLVLDTEVAKSLGYDSFTQKWNLNEDDEIEFNLVGAGETITLYPKFKISEISVAPLSQMGVSYEAVLGIDRWQHYVVGFSYVDYQGGGPDGTILMLFRPNLAEAYSGNSTGQSLNYQDLEGLNSIGDDRWPSADNNGDLIAFQSNRPNGMGGWDIYLWRKGEGILTFPNLNSTTDDEDPSLSGDGRYLVFHSDREGGAGDWDIYLYDIENRIFVDMPGLNTSALERTPAISTNGRYIAFRSEREGNAGDSDIYLYDRDTESLVPLPGLNSSEGDFGPVLNSDGTLIAFDHDITEGGGYDSDVYLYNVATHTLDTLADINGASWDMDGAVSPDGTYVTLNTNRHNPDMGLFDRNFLIYNRETGSLELFSGLNSEYDEEGLSFTGNSKNMVFHSSRPGGMGGSDIYFYSLINTAQTASGDIVDLPNEEILLNLDENSGTYTLTVTTEEGDDLTLLLDTGVSGIILFSDSAPSGNRCEGPASVVLPYGTLNAAEQICLGIRVGEQTADTRIPVISGQSKYNAIVGRTDLPAVDGVIGFRGNFQNEFNPKILFMEYSFINGEELGLDIRPGLTIGNTPVTSLARGQGEYLLDTWLDGVIDPIDPYGKSYTNMDVTFLARTDTGEECADYSVVMLSSILNDTLILDFDTAKSLGYSEIKGWDKVKEINLFFANEIYILPADLGAFPVEKVRVADLSEHHCKAILSADRWVNSFIVGFASIDYQFGGPWGTVSLLHVKDIPALKGDYLTKGRNYISLPGLNSASDDDYPTASIDGQTIAFQSNRNGDKDVFVYRIGQGLIELSGLNSSSDDEHPCISGDGRLVVFHSDRSGDQDIYLYDIEAQAFIDLPELNSEYDEWSPSISADGSMIAFLSVRPDSVEGSWDIYLYSLTDMQMTSISGGWVNTSADEDAPVLNKDATLLSFIANDRPDSVGDSDVFVYDLVNGRLLELPEGTNETFWNDGVISTDGKFVLCTYYEDTTDYIKLMELSSGEFIYMPGLNTAYNDWGLQATPNAQYIVFESDRPGGMGGWDIYIYQRDETDTNTYTVTNSYDQNGYVTDEDGNRVADEEIRAYDKTNTLIGTAITDELGNFTITVPQGSQLGITFESVTSDLNIVTDDVGDDTYVPDFEAGNLKFTEVWIEDTAQAGLSSTIHFDIEATVPKYNTYVTVYLKAGNPGDIVIDDTFIPDYELTSLIIDKLGFNETVSDPVVKEQKDTTTSVTYYPDTNNRKAYVEHTFIVPQGIPDGVYTAVFAINTYDITTEDDDLQGESDEDLADNYMVASASTIIGTPSLPNLRILSHELFTNSFELPSAEPDPTVVPEQYDLSLNLEVESMAQDTTQPVDITFDLMIGEKTYSMTFAEPNGYGVLQKKSEQTYDVECRPEDREGYPSGDRCASLYRQEQTGKTYSLFMNADAYEELNTLTSDTICYLVVKMDPDRTIAEYNDNVADNTISIPVMFLAPETAVMEIQMSSQPGSTLKNMFDLRGGNTYGNSDFGIGYEIGPKLDYMQVIYDGYETPYAANFIGTGKITGKLFGNSFTPLEVGPKFDFDFSSGGLEKSYFEYGVWTFGTRIWGYKHTMPYDYLSNGYIVLWDSTDDNGNEKYAKRKEKKKSKSFMVGPVPITVEGGIVGEIGIRGSIKFETGNKLSLEAGPYTNLKGTLEGGVGVPGFTVGVGVELVLIDIGLNFSPSIMVKPEVPIAIVEMKVPITITTLSGEAYLFARALFWTYKHTVIAWDGYSYEIQLFPLWYKGYGATDMYNTSYYPSTDFTGTSVAGPRLGFLSFNWGYGGPSELNGRVDYFSAVYEGYFEFSGTDDYIWGDSSAAYGSSYTFYVNSDDNLTIKLDDEVILDNSFGQKQFTEDIASGFHKLTVNYNELHSPAYVQLYWTSPNQFATFYYNNIDFSGDPVLFETNDKIDESWGDQSPKPGVVNSDNFSVRYEGNFTFPVGTDYMFTTRGDDVVRIYVDDVLVLNNNGVWYENHAASAYVAAGTHKVRVEYIEYSGWANIKVDWAPVNTFVGAYFNTRTFSGVPKRISNDDRYFRGAGLWDYYFMADFGEGRPANDSNVNYDNFSVKWAGAFYFEGGDYEFVIGQDDQMSVWVDDRLIGSYTAHSQQHLVTVPITAGWHIVRMNYVEYNGGARAVLKWGKKKKNVITEYYVRSYDELGNMIPSFINRRGDMDSNWGHGAPQGDWPLHGDDYDVIWEGDFDFEGAPYRFKSGADDFVKVYLDNVLVVEAAWRDWQTFDYSIIAMNPGTHHIKAVFHEYGGGAWAKVAWEKLEPDKFYGKKFDSSNADAQYDVNTTTNYINYDWGSGSPIGSTDNFLIVWNGVINIETDGVYHFYGSVDDDLHVWIDNEHVCHRTSWGTYSFDKTLKKGPHSIKLRFWEGGGGAHAKFHWYRK